MTSSIDQDRKVRENRLRRMADRQGAILQKSPRRDKRAKDYGLYRLLWQARDQDGHARMQEFVYTLREIEMLLTGMDD